MNDRAIFNFLFKYLFVGIYTAISVVVFNRVYETSKEVIDEEFHTDQGLHYCNGYFERVRVEIILFTLRTFKYDQD